MRSEVAGRCPAELAVSPRPPHRQLCRDHAAVPRLMAVHTKRPTPRSQGYRTPAEWERHRATWIGWPQNRSDWPGKFDAIPWAYAEVVRYLARAEHVHILVRD